jgi:hypothetical protein
VTTNTSEGEQQEPERLETLASRSQPWHETADSEALILSVIQATAKAITRGLAASVTSVEVTTEQRRHLRQAILELRRIRDQSERSRVDAEDALDALKAELDSMSEIGESDSLRLQIMLDRRAKLIQTLSNMLKKISETQDQIVSNLK